LKHKKCLRAALRRILCPRKRQASRETIDGGVIHRIDENAPKKIRSSEILCFHCEFSTLDLMWEDSPIAGRVMILHAEKDLAYCHRRNTAQPQRYSFRPDESFFRALQQIVLRYDFAQYNGQHYTVSGLPPDFGMKLQILYQSGESICASNNQSCFLPLEAMETLAQLFQNSFGRNE